MSRNFFYDWTTQSRLRITVSQRVDVYEWRRGEEQQWTFSTSSGDVSMNLHAKETIHENGSMSVLKEYISDGREGVETHLTARV